MQVIGEPIGAVEDKVLTNQIHVLRTSSVECDTSPKIFAPDENLGNKLWVLYISLCKGWIRCHLLIKLSVG